MPTLVLPVFRAAGAKSAGLTGATAVAAPAGVATGDLEILVAEVRAADTCSITTNGGSAWTAMTGTPVSVAAGEKLYVWSRVRQAGDSDPSVTPSADHVDAGRLAYQVGTFDPQDPFENEVTGTEATVDNSYSFAPGGSTAGDSRLVLSISTILRDSNVASVPVCTNASLTNLASRADFCTTSGAGGGFGITEGRKAVAGTVGTFACTYAATSAKAYISFAIKPFSTASGSATASAAARTTATGAKGGTSAATASARAASTATGVKGGQSSATVSAAARVTASGFAPIVVTGSASMSAAARTVATGAKGGTSEATASAQAQSTSTGAKGGQSAATASNATRTTSTGAKGGTGAATCSGRSQTTAAGAKGALSQGSVLTDDFDDGSVCTGRWPAASGVSESGGRGVLPFIQDGDWIASTFRTASDQRINDRTFTVEVVRAHSSSAGTFLFGIGRDTGRPFASIYVAGSNINYEFDDGTFGFTSQPYDPAVHRWWRIREAAGTVYFETSVDGISWTLRKTSIRTIEWGLQPLKLWASKNSATAIPDALIDNLSVTETGVHVSAGLRATATGAKGGQGGCAATASARATAAGLKGASSTATATASTSAAATGAKGGSSTATVSGGVTVTVSGSTEPPPPSGSATASAGASASASGFKGGVSSAQATAAARTTATGSKSTSGAASASASARASAAGAKGGMGSASVSIAGNAASSGMSSRAGAASISVRATVTATAATVSGGSATITAGVRVTASGHANTTVPGGQRVHITDRGRVRVVPRDLPTVERGRVD